MTVKLDKVMLRRASNNNVAYFAPGRQVYVLETNGALDRYTDPGWSLGDETLVEGFLDEALTLTEGTGPFNANADGQFDVWFPAGNYDLYSPADATGRITRWQTLAANAQPAQSFGAVNLPQGELTRASPAHAQGTVYAPGPQLAVTQPDTLFVLEVDNERDALEQNIALSADYDNYFLPATAKAALAAGPGYRKAIGPGSGGKDHLVVVSDGLLPRDEFTLEFQLKSNGVDYTAQAAGGTFFVARTIDGGGTSLEEFRISRPSTGVLRFGMYRATVLQTKADIALSAGNIPADTWVTVSVALFDDSAGNPTLQARVVRGATTYSGVFSAVASVDINDRSIPFSSSQRGGGGISVNSPWDGSTASGAWSIAEVHIMRYARLGGPAGISAPGAAVTVDASQAYDGKPIGDLAGVFAQYAGWRDLADDADPALRDGILGLAGASGMKTMRVPIIWDRVGVTDNGGAVGPSRFTYDWSSFDDPMDAMVAAGVDKFAIVATYCPLNLGATRFDVPNDNALYAQMCSDLLGHLLTRYAGMIASFAVWNEPDTAGWWTGTTTQFRTMWLAVRAKLATDHPTHPLTGPDGGSSHSVYASAVLAYCAANNLPLPLMYSHDYSGDLAWQKQEIKYVREAADAAGLFGVEVAVTEWNWPISEILRQPSASLGQITEPTFGQRFAAYAHAFVAGLDSLQYVPHGAFTRLGQLEPPFYSGVEEAYGGLVSYDDPPHPFPIFGAFQAMWKHGRANRIQAISNWEGLHCMASKDDDGVITVTYGTYRHWRPDDKLRVSFGWDGLPTAFAWKRWYSDLTTSADGRMFLAGQGDETNLPIGLVLDHQSVGCIQITPAPSAAPVTVAPAVPLSSLLLADWDPDAITGITSGASTQQCPDSSGHGRVLNQPTAGARPLWVNNILNGHAVLRFDGVNDGITALFGYLQPMTVFVVARWLSGLGTVIDGGGVNGLRLYRDSTTSVTLYQNGALGSSLTTTPGAWHVYAMRFSAVTGKAEVRVETGAPATGTLGTLASGALGVSLGAIAGAGSDWANVEIARVLPYRALGDAETTRVSAYLRAKYAI